MFLSDDDQKIIYQATAHDVAALLAAAVQTGMAVDMAVARFPEVHAALYGNAIRAIMAIELIPSPAPTPYPQNPQPGVAQMPPIQGQSTGVMPQMVAPAPPPQIPQAPPQPVGYPAQAQPWGLQGSPQGQVVPPMPNGQPQPQSQPYPPQYPPQASAPAYAPAPTPAMATAYPVTTVGGAPSPAPYPPQGAAQAVAAMPAQGAGYDQLVPVPHCPRGRSDCLISRDQFDLSMLRRGVAMCTECYRDPNLPAQLGGPNK